MWMNYNHTSFRSSHQESNWYITTPKNNLQQLKMIKKKYYLQKIVKPTSSNNCNMMVSTSGCALSISSKSTTAFGQAFSCFVSWPPSSWPMYPGGEPINFATYTWSYLQHLCPKHSLCNFLLKYSKYNSHTCTCKMDGNDKKRQAKKKQNRRAGIVFKRLAMC